MERALVIGGTKFIGRHLVVELLENEYDVTLFNRGSHENPFADDPNVDHFEGDRTNDGALEAARDAVDPDVVFDVVAYHPRDVESATRIFADGDAYVYVSSGEAYAVDAIPKREDDTPWHDCTDEQATDDTFATYGNRKAEGDRAVVRAAERGVRAMSVRPPVVYGPHDYRERLDYWLHRIDTYDRIVVPGDGTNVWHRAFAPDLATALRLVAEEGTAGEVYNVADQNAVSLDRMITLAVEALDASVEVVHASERELSIADLDLEDFPLYRPYPHLLSTAKLAGLGWESTPVDEAMAITVEDHRESDRDGRDEGPLREAEERVLGVLETI
ncbi:Nucleoside-diphosphate-sugar epimerase [Halanaeroarchaeum sp. HSR-CO]|uniref:NAD-dependent epimerase/dehydratase family protein n=1 Tax=Halanaeroarchaeum sp. HSR-CO TaxID=2866382 RepID=UPI00217E7D5B|nr:NAD-dependent epimerase/dehydratase family protein [Halanaeroarchaeum sp. HSR-CO]UWG47340.1 Nucleoside-diphosphate-sugar epimerase [Halanaeroarchaeum sp. HSR-CO]